MSDRAALLLVGQGRGLEVPTKTLEDMLQRGLVEYAECKWWLTDTGWDAVLPEIVP